MTPLEKSKPIKRRANIALDNRKLGDDVIVSLYPDKTIGFRRLRHREELRLTLSAIYSMAIKAKVREEQREKKARHRGRTSR